MRDNAQVNAANSLSFMPMDGGVSGALRQAMNPDLHPEVIGAVKTWYADDGKEHEGQMIPSLQAAIQSTTGPLRERGVKWVIHCVGPIWTDWPIKESTFSKVLPRIRKAVSRALDICVRLGLTSIALPAISGGIFTHYRVGSNIKAREQRAARRAVIQAVFTWVDKHTCTNHANQSTLTDIELSDLPGPSLQVFQELFVEAVKQRDDAASHTCI